MNALAGISCPSAGSCIAVGSSVTPASGSVLVERWDGSAWQSQTAPNPPGAANALFAVSCASATACQAVGLSTSFRANGTGLAEGWDGHVWTVEAVPASITELLGVACAATDDCTAVGSGPTAAGQEAAVVHWDGTRWTAETSAPLGAGVQVSQLNAVACTAGAVCQAVGFTGTLTGPSANMALAEGEAGGAWSLENASNIGSTELLGVSCPRAALCTAVGLHGAQGTIAERSNGVSWQLQHTPTGDRGVELTSVACATPFTCTAVGQDTSANGFPAAVIEHWSAG